MIEIKKKIVDFEVLQGSGKPDKTPAPQGPDPLEVRIERRPEGELNATVEKVVYWTQEGKKSLYLVISYMPVQGVLDGKEVTIERPVEFFIPASQSSEDPQWITATMRSLSLAARGGYAAKALADLRKVAWTKGPVRCGSRDFGNGKTAPVWHPSEVAAVAYAIQQALHRRGFLDVEGNQVPSRVLARRWIERMGNSYPDADRSSSEASPAPAEAHPTEHGAACPQCGGGNLTLLDGCQTCLDCGHSKCG